jgi:hypothetical protein
MASMSRVVSFIQQTSALARPAEHIKIHVARPRGGSVELTLAGAVPWLVRNRLVPASAVVDARDGRVEVRDYTRRNRNVKVLVPRRAGVLLKQAMEPDNAELSAGVAREAATLRAFARAPALAPMRRFVPTLLRHDPRDAILATALVHPATTLGKLHQARGVSPASSLTVGRILARLRVAGIRAAREGSLRAIPRETPAALRIPTSLDHRAKEDPHAAALRDALHGLPFAAAPERVVGLVHGDARWDNFLLTSGAGPRGELNARLVDWELAHRGDPAWDLGYALCEHVRAWLVDGQRQPPQTWHAAVAQTALGYRRTARLSRDSARALRETLLRNLALHLAVHAYEALPVAPARPKLPLDAARLARAAHDDPARAARDLLGEGWLA